MSYLIPREVVELLLHRHLPVRISKCILYLVWLNRRHKRVMFTKMSNSRSSVCPLVDVTKNGVDGGDLFKLLGGLSGVVVFDLESLDHLCWALVLKCYELRTRQHKKC
jgi:hypothetical protein